MAKSITRRTLLGFRKRKANMWAPEDLINKIKNQPELFIKKVHDLIGKNVKIKAIVGNPPYQDIDGGGNGAAATPIYNLFVNIARKIDTQYISFVMPARWYGGGRGLDEFRESMLSETHIQYIKDFPNPKDCFSNANISGGICFFLWNKDYRSHECVFVNYINGNEYKEMRTLNQYDIFIRYNKAISIIENVKRRTNETIVDMVSQYMPFGIRSYERGNDVNTNSTDLKLISSKGEGYVKKEAVTASFDYVDKYNVIIGKAISGHLGETDADGKVKVLATTAIIDPYTVTTESYLCIGKFATKDEARNLYKYIITKFARFLLLQGLSSMNITKERFLFVPLQDFTSNSDIDWTKTISEIDTQLYAKYNLTNDEISFIESMIKPM